MKDDPANIEAHYRLALLYRRTGRTADFERETDAFNHYKDEREKLDKVFRQLGGAVRENPAGPGRDERPR